MGLSLKLILLIFKFFVKFDLKERKTGIKEKSFVLKKYLLFASFNDREKFNSCLCSEGKGTSAWDGKRLWFDSGRYLLFANWCFFWTVVRLFTFVGFVPIALTFLKVQLSFKLLQHPCLTTKPR